MSKIIWKGIKNYTDFEVSNQGQVREKEKHIIHNDKDITIPARILKQSVGRYLEVSFGGKQFRVDKLVADAFVDNPKNKPIVRHIDNDNYNCNSSNLQWVTRSENTQANIASGICKAPPIGNNGMKILCKENGKIYLSAKDAAEDLNIPYSTVLKNINRISSTSKSVGNYHLYKVKK
mgnify:CR=1 FL=1